MKKVKIILLSLVMSSLFYGAQAQINKVPASYKPIEYKQPDNTVLTIILKGDEKLHWAETIDGYTLIANEKNGYEYAKLDKSKNMITSKKLAHNQNSRTKREIRFLKKVQKGLSFSEYQIKKSKININ